MVTVGSNPVSRRCDATTRRPAVQNFHFALLIGGHVLKFLFDRRILFFSFPRTADLFGGISTTEAEYPPHIARSIRNEWSPVPSLKGNK